MRIFAQQLRSSLGSHHRRETSLLGSLTLTLALTQTRMGNTPSVADPDGGRLHVIRDDSDAGSLSGSREAYAQIGIAHPTPRGLSSEYLVQMPSISSNLACR